MMIHASIGDLEFCDPIPAIRFVEIPASAEYEDWKTRHGVYLLFYQDEPNLARVLEWVGMSVDRSIFRLPFRNRSGSPQQSNRSCSVN
jgi:hypothetical protein